MSEIMEKQKIDIVITDDHKLFRKGMASLLEDFDFVDNIYEAGNGIELLNILSEAKNLPDLVLLDLQMPEMDGMVATVKIRKKYPNLKIIILTMQDDEQIVLHMIQQGVNGYLMKNADPDELEKAIKGVLLKDMYFPENVSKLVYGSLNDKKSKWKISDLTDREYEVLNLICREFTANEIAEKLHVSPRTVEGYRTKLLDKTGAKNLAGLVVFALKNGLVEI
jgi:DNA-binding NarL/FixJ family response regulator